MGTNVGDRSRVSSRINNVKHVYTHAVLRLTMTLLVVGCSFVYCGTPIVVWAHEGHGADHAADDLVGTPVSKIERLTNDTKQKIQRETGQDPGADPQRRMNISGQESSAFAVSADPGISGKWSAVYGTQVVPVFQAVLPNGKVLIWDSVGDNPTESYPDQSFTRAMVWNPTNNTYRRVDLWGYNIFCAGFAHLPNGNILVAGGNKDTQLAGIVQTHIFNWQTETWTRGANMASGRWYPSVTALANGEMSIVGGGPATAEVYQTNGTLRALPGFTNGTYGNRIYPFMISRPDTQLSLLGPYTTTYAVNTPGVGVITGAGARDTITRDYGSFATYDIGKTLVIGGGNITEGGAVRVPTKTAVVVNNNGGPVPTVTSTGSMSVGRRQHSATILADGTVLVTGGMTNLATNGNVNLANAATAAERWNPTAGSWTVLASASRVRQYHSTAVLLPDGRVMTGGGGICGECVAAGYLEKNIEYFSPPYLFKKDGSGQLATRPVITTAPSIVSINASFTITSSQAASIRKVALVGLGDVTHSVDQGQRYIPLSFTVSGTTLVVTGPPTSGVAPPGYYMLVITDAGGVPSVAKTVQVAKSANPLMSAVRNAGAAKCIDVPNSSIKSATYVWLHGCNNTNAQALTRFVNDGTLRVLGNCLDVPSSNFVSGQKIWTYACNSTSAQRWQFGADATIRPLTKTTLCLTAVSTADAAAITIAMCNGSTLQKWTW